MATVRARQPHAACTKLGWSSRRHTVAGVCCAKMQPGGPARAGPTALPYRPIVARMRARILLEQPAAQKPHDVHDRLRLLPPIGSTPPRRAHSPIIQSDCAHLLWSLRAHCRKSSFSAAARSNSNAKAPLKVGLPASVARIPNPVLQRQALHDAVAALAARFTFR